MNKLAIIFVMLLGSVTTMQAQNTTFDFSCAAIDNSDDVGESDFSAEEIMEFQDLNVALELDEGAGFVAVYMDTYSYGNVQIQFSLEYGPEDDAVQNVPTYTIFIDGISHGGHNTLSDAIDAYMEFLDQTDG